MFPFAARQAGTTSSGPGTPDAATLLTRSPKLTDAAERVTAAFVKSLQKMASSVGAIDGHLQRLAVRDIHDVINDHVPSSAAGLINCPAVPCTMLVCMDGMMVHAIVDLLCGGNGKEASPLSLRDATAIDQQFAHIAVKLFAAAIEAEWAAAGFGAASTTKCDVVFSDVLGPKVREVGCIDISISIFGVAGALRLLVPSAGLDQFAADEDSDAPAAELTNGLWSSLLQAEIGHAPIRLEAYLDAKDIDLASLASLDVGQIISLPLQARTQASLVAQGQVLFRGEIGQADDRYSLRIDDIMPDASRLMPTIMSAPRARVSEPLKD